MCLCLSVGVCVSVGVFAYLCMFVCLGVPLGVLLCLCLSVCACLWVSERFCVCLWVSYVVCTCLSVNVYVCLSVSACACVCLCIFVHVCGCLCMSVFAKIKVPCVSSLSTTSSFSYYMTSESRKLEKENVWDMSPGLSHEVLLLPATSSLPPNLAPGSLSYVP